VLGIAEDIARELTETYCPREQHPEQWNTTQFANEVLNQFGLDVRAAGVDSSKLSHDELVEALITGVNKRYEEKEKQFGPEVIRWLERRIVLDVVDTQWKDHLLSLDHLKEGIGLRGYGQKDPLVEFKKEAFILFEDMMARIDTETVRYLFLVRPAEQAPPPEALLTGGSIRPRTLPDAAVALERKQRRQQQELQYQTGPAQAEAPKPIRGGAKIGRNDPCPCGSGKKYKKCCGKAA